MNILIIGSEGLIGETLQQKLIKKKIKLFCFDILKKTNIPNVKFIKGSIENLKVLYQKTKGKKIDIVIHLAAFLGVENTEKDKLKCLNINILGTKNVLDFCVKKKIKKIIFSSSSEVYGEGGKKYLKEDFFLKPKSVYGITKVVNEEYIKGYCKNYKLDFNICRFFNIYGAKQKAEFVIPKFIKKIKKNQPVTIFGNGNQIRSFCYVDDAANALIKLIFSKKNNKIYNIGNNLEPIKMFNLAKLIYKLANKKVKIKKISFNNSDRSSKREIYERKPDITKAIKELNYKPKIKLKDGLKKVLNETFI
jgi:UDP-glucose 4-epimerase